MASLTVLGVFLLLLFFVYKYIITPAFLSPLAKVPNAHFSSPVLPLWIWSKRRTSAGIHTIYNLHQKHGPAVRLGPNEISVCTAGALRTIYIGGFEKYRWYLDAFVNYGTQNMVSMLEHKPHSIQKRMVSNLYSKSFLQSSEDLQKASDHLILERFLPIIQSVAAKGIEMDVLDFFQATFMDITSSYLFGLTNGSNFMANVQYRRHWLGEYKKFKSQLPHERANSEVERFCLSLCEAAEQFLNTEKAKQHPLATAPVVYGRLQHSLRQHSLQSNTKPDPNRILTTTASELLDHLIAGHEASGITLTYLMHQLSQRPALQARLRAELLTLSPPITLSPSSSGNININNDGKQSLPSPRAIDALPLLDAILQETLRLHAAAPGPQPRLTPHTPTGTTIEGFENIPGGVRVSANAYTLHRNPEVFPEPEAWRPERWMDATGERKEEMKRWFWAFSSGGRMCVGSNFAIQEMKLVAAAVYSNFTTEIIDDEGIEQADSFISPPVGEKLILRFRRA